MGVAIVGSKNVSWPQNPETDPNVEQAITDIEGLDKEIQALQSLIEGGKGTLDQIKALRNQIVQDATALKSFMSGHASSFSPIELNLATQLNSWAGNLSILPPQDTVDISYLIGGMYSTSQTLYALLWPTK